MKNPARNSPAFARTSKTGATAVWLSVLLMLAGRSMGEPRPSLQEVHAQQFMPLESRVQDAAAATALVAAYQRYFEPARQEADVLTAADVRAGYLAAYATAFYAFHYLPQQTPQLLDDTWDWFAKLNERGGISNREALFLHRLLTSTRQFERAELVRQRHPQANLPRTPDIDRAPGFDPARPAVYTLRDNGEGFDLRNLDLDLSRRIVVVAGCHISRQAARDIQADPVLRAAFAAGQAIWLGSPDGLDIEAVREWNADVPFAPLHVVEDALKWPLLRFDTHPHFHFFRDGQLVASYDSWDPNRSPPPILESLRLLGLLDGPH